MVMALFLCGAFRRANLTEGNPNEEINEVTGSLFEVSATITALAFGFITAFTEFPPASKFFVFRGVICPCYKWRSYLRSWQTA